MSAKNLSRVGAALLLFLLIIITAVFVVWSKNAQQNKNQKKAEAPAPKASDETISCPPNCNVILISIDTLRADHLGVYGYQKPTTPNIDKFSQTATVFEKTFSQSSWTLPSHASMLTGKYPQKLGVEIVTDRLPQGSSITELIKNNDYKTAAITSGMFVDDRHGFSQGFDTFETMETWQDAEILTQKAESWLTQNQKNKFFLFLHYFHIHDPYSPQENSAKAIDPDYSGNLKSIDVLQINKLNIGSLTLPQADLQHLKTLYDAELSELDNALGRLFTLLTETKLTKNSIIIITSDHGEEFGEHGAWGMHAYSLYDELIHVPLIIRVPNLNLPQRSSNFAEIVDIPKTIISLLNLKSPQELDGINLIDNLQAIGSKKYVYSETSNQKQQLLNYIERYGNQKINVLPREIQEIIKSQKEQKIKTRMIRSDKWKLIHNFNNSFELYDLEKDPKETTNVISQNAKEFEELKKALAEF